MRGKRKYVFALLFLFDLYHFPNTFYNNIIEITHLRNEEM